METLHIVFVFVFLALPLFIPAFLTSSDISMLSTSRICDIPILWIFEQSCPPITIPGTPLQPNGYLGTDLGQTASHFEGIARTVQGSGVALHHPLLEALFRLASNYEQIAHDTEEVFSRVHVVLEGYV